jgi:hypothetical protein
MHEWELAERAVGQAIESSPEPFDPATIANVHEFINACRIQCPKPDGVAKGYWSTIRIWWKNLEIEVFDDHFELYCFVRAVRLSSTSITRLERNSLAA